MKQEKKKKKEHSIHSMQKVDEVPSSEENIMNSKLLLITSKSRKFKFDSIILDFKHEIKNYI